MEINFETLSSRTIFNNDFRENMRLYNLDNYLRAFENYTYGVILQNFRILDDDHSNKNESHIQISLDVYYYILTWDKLKKIFDEIKRKVNKFYGEVDPIFFENFKRIRHRLEHLFLEIPKSIRNEYEHPSLKPHIFGNKGKVIVSNVVFPGKNGDLRIHVGKDEFADVKKEHIERLLSCWVELTDLFIKHFSDKPLS